MQILAKVNRGNCAKPRTQTAPNNQVLFCRSIAIYRRDQLGKPHPQSHSQVGSQAHHLSKSGLPRPLTAICAHRHTYVNFL